jgi:hypothetical protein
MKTMMRTATLVLTGAFVLGGCSKDRKQDEQEPAAAATDVAKPIEPARPALDPAAPPAAATGDRQTYLDVHEIGPGKVTLEQVAEAHKKDLDVQAKHGVTFTDYWVDEKNGRVYCLSEAPSADAPAAAHKEAHGLVPQKVFPVVEPDPAVAASGGKKLFLDIHNVGPGKLTADAVKDIHQKDLAAQGKHDVAFLRYWLDADSGTVVCLSEAATAEAPNMVHKDAHGAVADEVVEVKAGT